MIGFFDEGENNKSMSRLLAFMGTIVGLGAFVAQQVKHLIDPSFQIEYTSLSVFISTFLALKLVQKYQELKK